MTAYAELMSFQRETEALGQVMQRLGWDQETVMPQGSAAQRSEEMAALEGVLHARRTDPRLGDWLSAAEATDEVAGANLREIRRRYERNLLVPARLAAEIARVTSRAQGIWAEARAAEDVAGFLPVLEQVVALRREFFSAPYPADTIAEIRALYDPKAMIEIEAIAAVRREGGN